MIQAVELTKQYRRVRAVDGVTFSAAPRRVTGFLGLNGSGKTTTLRMLLGLTVVGLSPEDAGAGDRQGLLVAGSWATLALAGSVIAVHRDLTGD